MAGGAMTLANLEDLVRNLTFEESADTGLFTSTRLDSFINQAHRELYGFVANIQPSFLSKISGDKSITSTGLDISSTNLDAQGVHVIVRVEIKDSNGNYVPVEPGHVTENASSAGSTTGDLLTFVWYMVGEKVYLNPLPTNTQTLRIIYVPNIDDLKDSETVVSPFAGALKSFHAVIGWRAADLSLSKDEKNHLHPRFLEMREDMKNYIRRRHVQGARRVRMTPFDEE